MTNELLHEEYPDDMTRETGVTLAHDPMERITRSARELGRIVTRPKPSATKAPGAVLSSESSRALRDELDAIRESERQGAVGADNYYVGFGQLDSRG